MKLRTSTVLLSSLFILLLGSGPSAAADFCIKVEFVVGGAFENWDVDIAGLAERTASLTLQRQFVLNSAAYGAVGFKSGLLQPYTVNWTEVTDSTASHYHCELDNQFRGVGFLSSFNYRTDNSENLQISCEILAAC